MNTNRESRELGGGLERQLLDYESVDLVSELKVFATWAVSSLTDAAFLVLWVLIQWSANQIIARFELSGIDKWVFFAFQVLFAISTLIPVIVYIYVDSAKILWQAKWIIRQEERRRERERND